MCKCVNVRMFGECANDKKFLQLRVQRRQFAHSYICTLTKHLHISKAKVFQHRIQRVHHVCLLVVAAYSCGRGRLDKPQGWQGH